MNYKHMLAIGNSKVAKSSVLVFSNNIIAILVSFVLQVFVARILGADSFGEYVYILTISNFLSMAIKGGVDLLSIRFIAKYDSQGNVEKTNQIISFGRRYIIVSSVFILLIANTLLDYYGILNDRHRPLALMVAVVVSLFQLECAYLQAKTRTFASQFLQNTLRPVGVLIGLFVYYRYHDIPSVNVVVYAHIYLVSVFVLSLWLLRSRAGKASGWVADDSWKMWLKASYGLALIALFNLIINQVDVLIVGYKLPPDFVGIYSACSRVSSLVQFPIVAIGLVLAPYISKYFSNNELIKLQNIVAKASLATIAVSVFIISILLTFADDILGVYGSEFKSGVPALMILLCSRFVNAVGGISGYMMTMSGHHKIAAKILGGTVLFCVFSNIVLVDLYGINGAAVSVLLSTVIWVSAMSFAVIRKTGVSPFFIRTTKSIAK